MVKRHKRISSRWLWPVGALIAVVLIGLWLANIHHKRSLATIPSRPSSQASPASAASDSATAANSAAAEPAKSLNNTPTVNGPLIAPSGQFVSNHRPGANGTSTAEQSVCNTTPGASCYIEFTKDGVTKKLAAQVTDGDGSTIWNWKVSDAGLTQGDWQITAVAAANGQTKTATDQIPLEIS